MNSHLALNRKAGLRSIAKLPLLPGLSVEREMERERAVPDGLDRNAGSQGLFCHFWVEAKCPQAPELFLTPRTLRQFWLSLQCSFHSLQVLSSKPWAKNLWKGKKEEFRVSYSGKIVLERGLWF